MKVEPPADIADRGEMVRMMVTPRMDVERFLAGWCSPISEPRAGVDGWSASAVTMNDEGLASVLDSATV
jgi:hypothetical protein